MTDIQLFSKKKRRNYTGEDADDSLEYTLLLLGLDSLETPQPIDVIRKTVKANVKNITRIDPYNLLLINALSEDGIFIDGNNVRSREEVLELYPFTQLNTTPEQVYKQQRVHIFNEDIEELEQELISADYDNNDVQTTRSAMESIFKKNRSDLEDVKTGTILTRVFVAKEGFQDFLLMCKTIRASINVTGSSFFAQLLAGDPDEVRTLLLGPAEEPTISEPIGESVGGPSIHEVLPDEPLIAKKYGSRKVKIVYKEPPVELDLAATIKKVQALNARTEQLNKKTVAFHKKFTLLSKDMAAANKKSTFAEQRNQTIINKLKADVLMLQQQLKERP